MPLIVRLHEVSTPIGDMLIAADAGGVCLLEFTDVGDRLDRELARLQRRTGCVVEPGESPHARSMQDELRAYFAGSLRRFRTPLSLAGTDFQQRVWRGLLEVGFGETRSYAGHAAALGAPRSVRAVGHANGANPICIVIPCHRLIGSNGALTGYGGGVWRKEWLLRHEGAEGGGRT